MRFTNREQAARLLAERLITYKAKRPLVLGIPRGGVPMARIIADALGGDLDVVLVRKLRAPGQPERAIGAVDESGHVLKSPFVNDASPDYLEEEVRRQREILRIRRTIYGEGGASVKPAARDVIIVDDGVATGATMLAAIRSVRRREPQSIVVAVAVAPAEALYALRREAEDVVCLHAARVFHGVGDYFDDFPPVSDEEVIAVLDGSRLEAAGHGPS